MIFLTRRANTFLIRYNASHTYTMQELVKEVTLKNHSNNGLWNWHTELLTLSVLMHISPTIHYNAGHNYKISIHYNTGADEFVAWKYIFSLGGFLR